MSTESEDYLKMSRFKDSCNSARDILINNYPTEDFLGFTPTEMEILLYDPFSFDSPFKIKKDHGDILDQIPFFLLTERLLKMVKRDHNVKLTPTGRLPLKYCAELLGYRFIREEIIDSGLRKLTSEECVYSIKVARLIIEMGGLVDIKKNKIYLTDYK